ncbi:hypothetical protein F4703DRAFT_1981853 [Phycomyces blakesleeanus]
MLASELFFEITLIIASFLQPKDKVQCCLVCKAWHPAFQESLFETLIIQTRASIDKLTDPTNSAGKLLQKYGFRTQTLQIIKNLRAETLTNLEITMKCCIFIEPRKTLNLISSNLCRLKRIYFHTVDKKPFIHTFDDFEFLNDQLPELTYISLSAQFQEMSPAELLKIERVSRSPCFKTLESFITQTAYGWMCHLAVKYPNISTLKTVSFSQSIIDLQSSRVLKMLATLPSTFNQLKNIAIHVENCSEHLYYDFVNQLRLFNIPIKTVEINVLNSTKDYGPTRNVLLAAQIFANKLERIKIIHRQQFRLAFGVSYKFACHPRLVDFNIQISKAKVILDTILESCPSLRIFTITDGDLIFMSNSHIFSIKHGLRNLSLNNMSIPGRTFNQISTCCNKLSNMQFRCLIKLGLQPGNDIDTYIDMSSTYFTKLNINDIQFLDPVNQVKINIFIFSSSVNSTEKIWIYSNPTKVPFLRNHQQITQRLNEKESRGIGLYFHEFPMPVRALFSREQLLEPVMQFSLNGSERELYYGYATFKCGSIRSLVFDA